MYLYLEFFFIEINRIVCIPHPLPPPLSATRRGLNHLPKFQKWGLERISVFRGTLLGKLGGDLFSGGRSFSFYIKNKLKS